MLRAGKLRWSRTLWCLHGNETIIHAPFPEGSNPAAIPLSQYARVPLDKINSVKTQCDIGTLRPPLQSSLPKYCTFALSCTNFDIFCCVEKSPIRTELIKFLRIALLKHKFVAQAEQRKIAAPRSAHDIDDDVTHRNLAAGAFEHLPLRWPGGNASCTSESPNRFREASYTRAGSVHHSNYVSSRDTSPLQIV